MTNLVETIGITEVPANLGRLLENQLKKWKGGSHHPRGIAEYITNSDDSYRRLDKFIDQNIYVEIHSRRGKMIDKLIIKDYAEGMSFDDLENRFFRYFESFSGREKGEKVTRQFGTGGKAYAIMNFRKCWIISIQNNRECKAWFEWDYENKRIIKGYNNGGYKDKPTQEKNSTILILENSYKVNQPLEDLVKHIEKLARIRHVLKQQNVFVTLNRKGKNKKIELEYKQPLETDAKRIWRYKLPNNLFNSNEDSDLVLRYFGKPLNGDDFIDLTDGISSVADLHVTKFDNRPFANSFNGSLLLTKLLDSSAVRENRKGLEEDDDLTIDIEEFIKVCVKESINEVEEEQRQIDKERKLDAANKKLKELSKFLSKKDLKFRSELKELRKRFQNIEEDDGNFDERNDDSPFVSDIYRKPIPEDNEEELIKGKWVDRKGENGGGESDGVQEFVPDDDGEEFAVKVKNNKSKKTVSKKQKQGLIVLMSNDEDNPESIKFTEFDDPVSDRDLETKGIIWINSVHPITSRAIEKKDKNPALFDENISNLVLMIVAQYYAQKENEMLPEDEKDDNQTLMLFRKYFFDLQREIREDKEISYFEGDK